MRRPTFGLVAVLLCGGKGTAVAQLWEVQLGAAASAGPSSAFQAGGGPVAGIAPGRLAYLGLRWIAYGGTTRTAGAGTQVRERVQTVTLDLALVIPAGGVEIMPGFGIGAEFFRQDTAMAGGAAWTTFTSTEFLMTPGIAAQVHLGRWALIPEVQYALSPHPRVPYPGGHDGLLVSLRLVYTFEVDRIRQ